MRGYDVFIGLDRIGYFAAELKGMRGCGLTPEY
jgi:hypothetical protein